jgi:creatinine amidohydrolase/Fe(II)-dependent formamide hydrolase-like protein
MRHSGDIMPNYNTMTQPLLPTNINTGPWLAGYSLAVLRERVQSTRVVLPVCSLGTSAAELAALGPLVLPPLYHEALDADVKTALLAQIRRCFPFYEGTRSRANYRGTFEVVEFPAKRPSSFPRRPKILAFGVDTTVEQHGPHLPLGTDTIQTYAVLQRLASETEGLVVGPPLHYGHLTWGLPFGLSVDITPALTARYMTGFVNALLEAMSPEMLYVADVHGSLAHRNAIQDGLRKSRCLRWAFRWLHEPIAKFGADRGDMHAGGVETALIQHINPGLVDARWWPGRIDDLAAAQMTTPAAIELSSDLPRFIQRVESQQLNGIVGDVHNAARLDARVLMDRMVNIATSDVEELART